MARSGTKHCLSGPWPSAHGHGGRRAWQTALRAAGLDAPDVPARRRCRRKQRGSRGLRSVISCCALLDG